MVEGSELLRDSAAAMAVALTPPRPLLPEAHGKLARATRSFHSNGIAGLTLPFIGQS
jgi:hypothetical protein